MNPIAKNDTIGASELVDTLERLLSGSISAQLAKANMQELRKSKPSVFSDKIKRREK